jgi:UDP-N-acetylmuramoylalanine--D-glutamate ligase
MQNVTNKKIVVLGAARSGIAVAQLLKRRGAEVFISDTAPAENKRTEIQALSAANIGFEFGGHSEKIYQADLAVLSPGIPATTEKVVHLQRIGIPVFSELEVASWYCQAHVIAITGSNGKTTTTTLLGEMLKTVWPQAIVAGNIGTPLSQEVEGSHTGTWGVVEVSSFQLEHIDQFHPDVVVLLNVSPNHLDRYPDYQAYIRAKLNILKNLTREDAIVCNRDDAVLYQAVQKSAARKFYFSKEQQAAHAYLNRQAIVLDTRLSVALADIGLQGEHNYLNCMAAMLSADLAGIPHQNITKILASFRGVTHRLEYAGSLGGITFINDSKSTTVESLRVALLSCRRPVHLIAGGRDKGGDFTVLRDLMKQKVASVHLIGEARGKLFDSWRDLFSGKHILLADTLDEAVSQAHAQAKSGDLVLFSPACASFDMFRNYEERGAIFKAIVAGLIGRHE